MTLDERRKLQAVVVQLYIESYTYDELLTYARHKLDEQLGSWTDEKIELQLDWFNKK